MGSMSLLTLLWTLSGHHILVIFKKLKDFLLRSANAPAHPQSDPPVPDAITGYWEKWV